MCSIDGCERPIFARGWCQRHYTAWKRNGNPLAWKKPSRGGCSVEGCIAPHCAKGLCDNHYRQSKNKPRRPNRPCDWCGEQLSMDRSPLSRYCPDCKPVAKNFAAAQRAGKNVRKVVSRVGRICMECQGPIDPTMHRRRRLCSEECQQANRRRYDRSVWLQRIYGITLEEYERMEREQDYRCAICRTDEKPSRGSWCVDHDHETGRVRGLLCFDCNSGVGHLKDDAIAWLRAARYLLQHHPEKCTAEVKEILMQLSASADLKLQEIEVDTAS